MDAKSEGRVSILLALEHDFICALEFLWVAIGGRIGQQYHLTCSKFTAFTISRATDTGASMRKNSSIAVGMRVGSLTSRRRCSGVRARCRKVWPIELHVVSTPASRRSRTAPSKCCPDSG